MKRYINLPIEMDKRVRISEDNEGSEEEEVDEIVQQAYGGDKGIKPPFGFNGFHHCEFYVSNAKQAADWYVLRMGFQKLAYRGLETGSRELCSHVVRQGNIKYIFTSPLSPMFSGASGDVMMDIAVKGDAVKNVAFDCDNVREAYEYAISRGAKGVREPYEISDEFGTVIIATLESYGKCHHSLIQRDGYTGQFLPGFKYLSEKDTWDPIGADLPKIGLQRIDHIVGNQPDRQMNLVADWYKNKLGFHRFWSVDDKVMHTQYSALRSTVMADYDEVIKMPLNEPAMGNKKSQIQEYVEYHGGAGVQHIAMYTNDIIRTITNLRSRGMKFLTIPDQYYVNLRRRLAKSNIVVAEDLDILKQLQILVDFDDQGYLLQIFTVPVEDRPTLFFEVIERHNNQGFGVGNFKALFQSIEGAQAERGNL